LTAALLLGCVVASCGGSKAGSPSSSPSSAAPAAASARPHTDAQLQIVTPTANQVTGPTTDLQLSLQGAQVVSPTQLTNAPNQGHVHVSIDGKLISMTYGLSQPLTGLTPGPHTLQAEFVANDHQPFANRVIAAVLFKVQG
jgi:hypothetical protein